MPTQSPRPGRRAIDDAGSDQVVTFDPPLTAAEQATYNRLVRIARALIPAISPAEWQAIESAIAGRRTYQCLPLADAPRTVMAVKSQSRILRAILRD